MKKSTFIVLILSLWTSISVSAENPVEGMLNTSKDTLYSLFDMVTGIPNKVVKFGKKDKNKPSTLVAFTLSTRKLIASGDPVRGQSIAKKHRCAKCHGDQGTVDDPEDPNIGGQLASYNYKQLMDYKNGDRDDHSMVKVVRKLSEKDIVDLVAWYASVPRLPPMHKTSAVAEKLIFKGDSKRMIKPCATCHGRNGEGAQHAASKLVGQSFDYFISMMEAFKEHDRTNDVYSRMRLISEQLTDAEIEALANYYSAEPPVEEE